MSAESSSRPVRRSRCQYSLRQMLWIVPLLALAMLFARAPLRAWLASREPSNFAFTTVQTSVSVPDAGTILVTGGGWHTNTLRSDATIVALCQSADAGRFRYLSVDGPQVTDAGLEELARLSTVRQVAIGSTTSTGAMARRRLHMALPDCAVHDSTLSASQPGGH